MTTALLVLARWHLSEAWCVVSGRRRRTLRRVERGEVLVHGRDWR